VYVDHRHHVHEAASNRQVGYVNGPHLVAPRDLQVAEQVGMLVLGAIDHSGSWHAIHRLYPHALHEPTNSGATDHDPLVTQFHGQAPGA